MKQLLFYVYFFSFSSLIGQDLLTDKMGAIPTNFIFTSHDEPLDIEQQFIIKASNAVSGSESAYGYETFWLEIETNTNIPHRQSRLLDMHAAFELNLYDERGEKIANIRLSSSEVKRAFLDVRFVNRRDEVVHFFGFDLTNVPLAILNRTRRIDIQRYAV